MICKSQDKKNKKFPYCYHISLYKYYTKMLQHDNNTLYTIISNITQNFLYSRCLFSTEYFGTVPIISAQEGENQTCIYLKRQ